VTVDPEGAPLEISSDIGFRDTAAWWFWQPKRDGFALVKYDSDSGLDAGDWIDRLTGQVKKLGVKLGRERWKEVAWESWRRIGWRGTLSS